MNEKSYLNTQLIDEIAYPHDVTNVIKILSLNKEDPAHIFGSYSYKKQLYSSDIDLLETDIESNSIEEAVFNLEKKINHVIEIISVTPGYYFSEFKAGLDMRYAIDVGELKNGIYTRSNPVEFMQKIMILSSKNLIKKKDVDRLFEVFNKKEVTADDYDIAFNILREYRIVRWTLNDLLNGSINLKSGITMTLNAALRFNTPIKIDIIIYIDGRFVEVTNFIIFVLKKGEDLMVLNDKQNAITDIKQNSIEGLQGEIDKVFFSTAYFNPFKGIKRLWSLARQLNDTSMLQALDHIISGDISKLYQKKSDIDTILNLFNKYHEYSPIPEILKELDELKIELDRIISFDIKYIVLEYSELINATINQQIPFIKMIQELNNILMKLNVEVAYQTMTWIQINNFSIPKEYLPDPPKYHK